MRVEYAINIQEDFSNPSNYIVELKTYRYRTLFTMSSLDDFGTLIYRIQTALKEEKSA